jgi:cation diffusion facilitator CzcD-associated flavoprotein CzcO
MAERVDVAIVGGGAAGLGLGARLRDAGFGSLTVFERGERPGGTWRANTYPGAACDVPSHLYSFSFDPNPRWSRRYSPQAEILRYFEGFADRHGLRPHLRTSTDVTSATWDEDASEWRLSTADGDEVRARFVAAACGQLSVPHVPAFAGLSDFAGPAWHSASWDHSVDVRGKRVAVIGSGASAIQIVPALAGVASHLSVFQRTPTWIIPRRDRAYTRLERELFARSDVWRRLYRSYLFWRLESFFLGFSPGPAARSLTRMAMKHLEDQVPDPALRMLLTPTYPIGCKRVLVSDDYYPALQRPDVSLVTTAIDRFEPAGVRTRDGILHELDAVVWATGFHSQSLVAPMRVAGPGGRTLDELWADGPQAHLGVTVAGMPNLFLLYGPNTNLGHNSILFMMEAQFHYIVSCLSEVRRRGASSIEVRPDAFESFNRELQDRLSSSVWAAGCSNWYKTDGGRVTNNWPGFANEYWRATRRPDFGQYALA